MLGAAIDIKASEHPSRTRERTSAPHEFAVEPATEPEHSKMRPRRTVGLYPIFLDANPAGKARTMPAREKDEESSPILEGSTENSTSRSNASGEALAMLKGTARLAKKTIAKDVHGPRRCADPKSTMSCSSSEPPKSLG